VKITKEMIKKNRVCGPGLKEFARRFPDGVELSGLVALSKYEWKIRYAFWLLDTFGAVEHVNEYIQDGEIFFKNGAILSSDEIINELRLLDYFETCGRDNLKEKNIPLNVPRFIRELNKGN